MPNDNSNYSVVNAIGDGNCAFNAFILGFCQKTTLDSVEALFTDENNPMHQFYSGVGAALKVESESLTEVEYRNLVKAKILDLREHNASELQKTLAPYMRNLACDLRYPESSKEDFIDVLQATYFEIKANTNLPACKADDVFSQHPLIMEKFKELSELSPKQSDDNDRHNLVSWWDNLGFNLFVTQMKQPGSWAGDVELAALAQHFKINLQIRTPDYTRQFHHEYGELDRNKLNPELLDQLIKRGVIVFPTDNQTVLPFILQPTEIRARLEAVPDVAGIIAIIAALPNELIQGVSAVGLPEASIDELKKRGVITAARNVPGVAEGALIFQGNKRYAMEAIKAISDDPTVINSILDCIQDKSPVIALENLRVHWNLLTKTNLTVPKEKWTKWRKEMEEKYENPVQDGQERVKYTLCNEDGGGEKTIFVTTEEQIEGDEALARKIHDEEEYAAGGRNRP